MRWWRTFAGIAEPLDARLRRIAAQRWVVVDCETSGLDPARDALLAIGGVAVREARVDVDDSFEVLVRPERPSGRENILIHGIGEGAQRDAVDPVEACRAFEAWSGAAPRVAFHASFDRAVLDRAARAHLGTASRAEWLDLAALAPALNPGLRAKALDDWLAHFGIEVEQRHHASADAFATAMLFLRLLAQVPPDDRSPGGLRALARSARWAG